MRLLRIPEPFDHPRFLFEPKLDGFRALAHIRGHRCELISRNGHTFKQWRQLAEELAHALRAFSAVLDGEICRLQPDGRSDFYLLMFRRDWLYFYAFDALSIEGEDLTGLPLLESKRRLCRVMPTIDTRLLFLDHLHERGVDLFRVACERDLEGIVAKWGLGTYRTDGRATSWLKIKNPGYAPMCDRHELFAARPAAEPRGRAQRSPDLVLV